MTAHEPLWLQFGPMGDVESVSNEPIEDHSEWHRVTPDAILLPRAEVEALMEAADVIARMLRQCTFQTIFIKGQYLDRAEEVSKVRTALAALQERMK